MPSSSIKSIRQILTNRFRSKTPKSKSVKSRKSKYTKLSNNTNNNSNKSNNANNNLKNICGSDKQNKGKSGIAGDYFYCNQGIGPCRKKKGGFSNNYIKCKKYSKRIGKKGSCPKGYVDCKDYGNKTLGLPKNAKIPKSRRHVRSVKSPDGAIRKKSYVQNVF